MQVGAGGKSAPLFIPEGETGFACVTGLHPKFGPDYLDSKKNPGKKVMRIPVNISVIDGEYAGADIPVTFWVEDTPKGYSCGRLQGLWTATGITDLCTPESSEENLYPWPESIAEARDAVLNEGEYLINGWGLKDKIFKFETGEPYVRTTPNGGTFTDTTINAYRTPSKEELADIQPLLDLMAM